MAWSILQNDDFINIVNDIRIKDHYEKLNLNDHELYMMSPKNLQIISECILELLKITPKGLGAESFINTQRHDKIKNYFCEKERKPSLRIDCTQCTKTLKKHILEFIEMIKDKQIQNYVTHRGTKYELSMDNISEISKVNEIVKYNKSNEEQMKNK